MMDENRTNHSDSDPGTLSPRELDAESLLSTEATESLHLPEKKKLPSLDELDANFVELDRVPDAYQDPVRVHQENRDELLERKDGIVTIICLSFIVCIYFWGLK